MTKQRLNGPTILTLIRIFLVLPMMIFYGIDATWAKIIALICFVVAAITDFIDGKWARKRHLVTNLGAFLDPLADKMLVNLTFLMFCVNGLVPVWMLSIILVRDFAVDGIRMALARQGETISASIWGKAKTMVQMIALTGIFLNLIINSNTVSIINITLLYISTGLTMLSGYDYISKGWSKATKQ